MWRVSTAAELDQTGGKLGHVGLVWSLWLLVSGCSFWWQAASASRTRNLGYVACMELVTESLVTMSGLGSAGTRAACTILGRVSAASLL